MHKTLDVITIGEAMAMFVATETGELSAVEHFIKRVAGAELNVATGLARLGLNVGWVSRVGRSSMTVCVTGLADQPGIPSEEVLKGVFEMVAVDAAGRPVAIACSYRNQETQP